MTALAVQDRSAQRAALLRLCIWLFLPLCAVIYQVSAKEVAACGPDAASVGAWLGCVLRTPWLVALVLTDVVSFAAWMFVLGELKLGVAFTMSALSYVLVIALSWIVYREPGGILQVVGSASIMAGVFLMGRTAPVED